MKIHNSAQSYTATASTSATGYPATNVAFTQTRKPWRSTVTTESWLKLDFGSSITPASVCLQDCNFASATVTYSADDISYSSAGTLTTYADASGRRKGNLEFANACRYVKITTPAGTPTDSAAYFSVGAVYAFLTVTEADMPPSAGLTHEIVYPQASYDLANGRTVRAELGAQYTMISGSTPNRRADDPGEYVRLARAGNVWIDLDISTNRERQWPMSFVDQRFSQALDDGFWPTSFSLKEIA